jgi:hypothetical protein
MKLQINDHRKIFAVQEEFNKLFPHLKIEFMSKPNKVGGQSSGKVLESSKKLGDCRVVHNKGELTLLPSLTAADLKQTFSDTYGLAIAIFHKSINGWNEISNNGNQSLQEQNAMSPT